MENVWFDFQTKTKLEILKTTNKQTPKSQINIFNRNLTTSQRFYSIDHNEL